MLELILARIADDATGMAFERELDGSVSVNIPSSVAAPSWLGSAPSWLAELPGVSGPGVQCRLTPREFSQVLGVLLARYRLDWFVGHSAPPETRVIFAHMIGTPPSWVSSKQTARGWISYVPAHPASEIWSSYHSKFLRFFVPRQDTRARVPLLVWDSREPNALEQIYLHAFANGVEADVVP